jgi:hypothetical protein
VPGTARDPAVWHTLHMSQDPETKQQQASREPSAHQPAARDSESTGVDKTVVEREARPREVGGRKGPDPTRYGDWEKNGRCIDF